MDAEIAVLKSVNSLFLTLPRIAQCQVDA
jgi:hypothetical protein